MSYMSKKGIEHTARALEQYYSRFPEWYWKFGLHDAVILSVAELELAPDWESEHPRRNCLEIFLDSSNALNDRTIRKICLYNYEIKTPDVNINVIDQPWWISDDLKELPGGRYLLDIMVEAGRGERVHFTVEFEQAETERN